MLPKICSFNECGRGTRARGLCATHYAQMRNGLELRQIQQEIQGDCTAGHCEKPAFCKGLCKSHYRSSLPSCSFEDCKKPRTSHGYCAMHAKRFRLYGDASFTQVILGDDLSRFLTKVNKTSTCWEWVGTCSAKGYGRFSQGGQTREAHRVSYVMHKGQIPNGMQIDHICHNPPCVNPEHLRIVTPKQNVENFGGLSKNNTSGVRGVTWSKLHKKWRAYVAHNNRRHYIGLFDSLNDANLAVVAKRKELHTHNDLDRF